MSYQQIALYSVTCLFILGCCALSSFVVNWFYVRHIQTLEASPKLWDDSLLRAAHFPLHALIWLWGGTLILQAFVSHTSEAVFWVHKIRQSGCILTFIWFLFRFVKGLEKRTRLHFNEFGPSLDITTFQGIVHCVRVALWCLAALVIVKYLFNLQLTGLWAIGGIGSFILGWAAKDLLSNYFGSMMIYLDRPFAIGEWISSPDRNIEGIVEQIGWRLTSVRTFDYKLIFIPNSVFASICVENPSRMTCRRIKENISLGVEDAGKIKDILQEITQMLKTHPQINQARNCWVKLASISHFITIEITCFTNTVELIPYQEIREEILLKCLDIIHQLDVKLAVPTMQLQGVSPTLGANGTMTN
ncbi:MAG: mechanosensitive ion channel family protein [Candidatus Berkiella sp.]